MTTQASLTARSVCVALAAAGLAASLAACSSSPPTPTPAASTTTSSSTSATGSATSSGSSTGSRTAAGNLCRIADAKAIVEPAPSGSSAGHIGLQVTVTNGGSAPCVVEGFPGVSLVTGTQGQELGAPAKRTSGTLTPVTLAPGAKIYLPEDTAAQFSAQTQQGCSNTGVVLMEIGPFAR